ADAEAFAKRGQLIVHDDAQERAAFLEGWRLTSAEAIAAFEAQQQAIATAAAEVAYAAQRMSAPAQAELAAADAAAFEHVTDIQPTRRRHRRKPRRAQAAVLHVEEE